MSHTDSDLCQIGARSDYIWICLRHRSIRFSPAPAVTASHMTCCRSVTGDTEQSRRDLAPVYSSRLPRLTSTRLPQVPGSACSLLTRIPFLTSWRPEQHEIANTRAHTRRRGNFANAIGQCDVSMCWLEFSLFSLNAQVLPHENCIGASWTRRPHLLAHTHIVGMWIS